MYLVKLYFVREVLVGVAACAQPGVQNGLSRFVIAPSTSPVAFSSTFPFHLKQGFDCCLFQVRHQSTSRAMTRLRGVARHGQSMSVAKGAEYSPPSRHMQRRI